MKTPAMSRRMVLEAAAACALTARVAARSRANADTGRQSKGREIVRKYYAVWESKDWHAVDLQLTDDFTFSSPLDDHIRKSALKTGCGATQIAHIDRFDLQQVVEAGPEAFAMHTCHTTNGRTFRNFEYFRLQDGKVKALDCYVGGKASFPSVVSTWTT